jgi:hypothetical protein
MRGLWEERACAQRIGLELVDNLVRGQAELLRELVDRGRRDEDVAAPSRRMATAGSCGGGWGAADDGPTGGISA